MSWISISNLALQFIITWISISKLALRFIEVCVQFWSYDSLKLGEWRRWRRKESVCHSGERVWRDILISTIGFVFSTCHTSMHWKGVNGVNLNGAKMISHIWWLLFILEKKNWVIFREEEWLEFLIFDFFTYVFHCSWLEFFFSGL